MERSPLARMILRALSLVERSIVVALIVMLVAVLVVAVVELWSIFLARAGEKMGEVSTSADFQELLQNAFGGILVVFVGLELLETMRAYFADHHIRVEVICSWPSSRRGGTSSSRSPRHGAVDVRGAGRPHGGVVRELLPLEAKRGEARLGGQVMAERGHWDKVYRAKSATEVSWYRPHLEQSIDLITRTGIGPDASIIDVGGGASTLAEDLLSRGFRNITVADISGEALDAAKRRLGPGPRR